MFQTVTTAISRDINLVIALKNENHVKTKLVVVALEEETQVSVDLEALEEEIMVSEEDSVEMTMASEVVAAVSVEKLEDSEAEEKSVDQ